MIQIGTIIKSHGLQGHMLLQLDERVWVREEEIDRLTIDLDGSLVPYLIQEWDASKLPTIRLKLDGVEDREETQLLVGRPALIRAESARMIEEESLVGYRIMKQDGSEIGNVVDVEFTAAHPILVVESSANQFLVPLVEEYVVGIDDVEQTITMDLPEGLIGG